MTSDEIEGSWCVPAEIERVLDLVIDGLAKLDADILSQLASHSREWEGKSHTAISLQSSTRASLVEAAAARSSASPDPHQPERARARAGTI